MRTVALKKLLDPSRPLTYGIVQAGPHIENGIPYIRPTDMTDAAGVADESKLLRTSAEIAAAYERASLRAGDVVLSIGPSYGKVMVVPSSLEGANLTQGTARLAPLSEISARWLYWVLQAPPSTDYWNAVVAGGTFRALNLGPLGETRVTLVRADEQRRIADFLDDRVYRIDRIIAARREQMNLIRSIPWLEFDAKLGAARQTPLRRAIATLADGPFGSAYSSNDYVVSGPAVIRLGNIGFNVFRGGDLARVPDSLFLRFPQAHVKQGDLLIASLGDANNHAGRACLVPSDLGPAMVKGKCFRARPNHEVASAEFLAVLLSSPRSADALVQQGTGATRSMLNFERLLSCRLPIPDRSQQTEIVDDFNARRESCQDAAMAVTDSINLLAEYKTSLITAAVTGELDVSTAGSNIPG